MPENSTPRSGDPDHHNAGIPSSPSPSPNPNANFAPPPPPSNTDYRHARFRPLMHPIGRPKPRDTHTPAVATATPLPLQASPHPSPHPKLTVVGVCSAGKSTLVRSLRERGFNARAVAQEHSYVPWLWQRSQPDVLIYLDANVHTIRGRGRRRWPQYLLDEEHTRLQHARQHSHLYIPTDGLSPHDVASRVLTYLSKQTSSE